jgi:hypothetical protein
MRSGSVAAVLITMAPPMQYPVVPILRPVSTDFCASSQATKAFASDTCVVALSEPAYLNASSRLAGVPLLER